MAKYRIITNPVAGRGNAARAEAIIDRILGRAGANYDLIETRRPNDAADLANEAIGKGYDVVVAVGGDGTVHEVVNGLVRPAPGTPIPLLGIIPLGTGNDFAWSLGLPENDPEAACRILLAGNSQVIDLGQVTDELGQMWTFTSMLGAGFDAAAAIEAGRIRRLRGLAMYLLAVLRVLPRYGRAPEVTVRYNGTGITRRLLMLSVANGRRTGGGFLIAPDARLDDGLFDLTLAGDAGIPTILRLIPHFIRGTHASQTRYVSIDRADGLVCEAPSGVPVHLEGEVIRTDARRLEIRILPRRLRVIVPTESLPS